MAYLGESDIAAMLADLAEAGGGVAVTLGSTTVTGLLDREYRCRSSRTVILSRAAISLPMFSAMLPLLS